VEDDGIGFLPRYLAPAAIAGLLVSLLLPWWRVDYTNAGGLRYESIRVWAFQEGGAYAERWATTATGLLVAAAMLLLFVRTSGRSWHYEPRIYRRDLWVAALLVAAGLASAWLWPQDVPGFWHTRGTDDFQEAARPAAGWWLALLSLIGVVVAAYRAGMSARKTPSEK
jgi:hypothetical protein